MTAPGQPPEVRVPRGLPEPERGLVPLHPGASGVEQHKGTQPGSVGAPKEPSRESSLARPDDPEATHPASSIPDRGLIPPPRTDVSADSDGQGGQQNSRELTHTTPPPASLAELAAMEQPDPAPVPDGAASAGGEKDTVVEPAPANPTDGRDRGVGGTPPEPPQEDASAAESPQPRDVDTDHATKGYIYHAREYQRIKQQERGFWGKMAHGLTDPFTVYLTAIKLRSFTERFEADPENKGRSPILTDALVKSVLDSKGIIRARHVSSEAVTAAKVTSEAHEAMLKLAGVRAREGGRQLRGELTEQERKNATEVLGEILTKKGELSAEDRAGLLEKYKERGLTDADITALSESVKQTFKLGESAGIKFQTSKDFIDNDVLTDQLLYGGLTPEQQQQAKKVALMTGLAAGATAARYGALFWTGGLSFWASVGAQAAITGASRVPVLWSQGSVYGMNKMRGAHVMSTEARAPTGAEKWLAKATRFMAVDWERDKATYPWQFIRAAAFGGALGAASHIVQHPGELGDLAGNIGSHAKDLLPHAGDVSAHAAMAGDIVTGKLHEINMPGVTDGELKVPDGWHFGDIHYHQDASVLYDNAGDKVASHFSLDQGQVHFQYDAAYAHAHGIDAQHLDQSISNHAETDQFSDFVREHGANVKVENTGVDTHGNPLPADSGNAPGTEAYGMTDYSNGDTFTIQAYDHLGDQANCLTTVVDGHHLVFLPTDHINGHPAWQFTPGDTTHTVTMWQDGHELVVTSDQASSMLHITHGELQNWIHSGQPAGTSSDFDYNVGQNILGHNVVYGHLNEQTGVIQQLGQIRGHSGVDGELSSTQYGEHVYEFPHTASPSFPQGEENLTGEAFGTSQGQTVHDGLLNGFDEYVADPLGSAVDGGVHFFGWLGQHNPTEWMAQHPGLTAGIVASTAYGFALRRYQNSHPESGAHVLAVASGGALTAALPIPYFIPGYPIGMAVGYVLGGIGKGGKEKAPGSEGSSNDKRSGPIPTPDQPFTLRPPRPSAATTTEREIETAAGASLPPAGSPPSQPPAPAPTPGGGSQNPQPASANGTGAPETPDDRQVPEETPETLDKALQAAEVPATQAIGASAGDGTTNGASPDQRLDVATTLGEAGGPSGQNTALEQRAAIGNADERRVPVENELRSDLAYRHLLNQPHEVWEMLTNEHLAEDLTRVIKGVKMIFPEISSSDVVQPALQRLTELIENKDASKEERLAAFESVRQAMARVRPPKTELVLVREAEEALSQGQEVPEDIAELLSTFPGGIAFLAKKGNPDSEPEALLKLTYNRMPGELTDDDFAAIAQAVYGDAQRGSEVKAAFAKIQESMKPIVQEMTPPPPATSADATPAGAGEEERPAA